MDNVMRYELRLNGGESLCYIWADQVDGHQFISGRETFYFWHNGKYIGSSNLVDGLGLYTVPTEKQLSQGFRPFRVFRGRC